MTEPEIFARARSYGRSVAFRTESSESSYSDLLERSREIAARILGGSTDLEEARVAFLISPGFDHVSTQWGIWRAGGIAVPLSRSATEPELQYVLTDSDCGMIVVSGEHKDKLKGLSEKLDLTSLVVEEIGNSANRGLPNVDPGSRAMILYTSGTTSQPKGVVLTHRNIQSQIESLVEAWEWSAEDRIPLFLPLHHIHGVVNICLCALWIGATVEPFPKFDIDRVLGRVKDGAYTVFMAVPTIYVRMILAIESMPEKDRSAVTRQFSRMRLMVSGSAALPPDVHEKWLQLTGQKLLERYGMTEIGMALSNPYRGERRPGAVGVPLPTVEVRLRSETGDSIITENQPGEIQVRGPGVFHEYWNRPDFTAESFDGGWFRTGDMALIENGSYRIMGRLSVDIIKSGGYKLSALEIEAVLLEHPDIVECAAVGIPDDTWGELVAVAIVLKKDSELDLDRFHDWCKGRLSSYKLPKRILVVDSLPRNAIGKVTKPALRNRF